jgi:uncharacterized protein YwgA
MDTGLIVLKLFLDELGIQDEIRTVDDRKRVQKAVYLGQLSGVDLGYRFSWYLMGPYSPSLTRDYFSLAEAIGSGERDYDNKELHGQIKKRLKKVKPLMRQPTSVKMAQEDWLELIASLHYLLRVSKYPKKKTINILEEKKPRLSKYISDAEEALSRSNLLT